MPLDSLPFELLSEILDSTRDVETLHQCVLVCSTFKEAALPSLYRTITLKTVHQMDEGLHFGALETLDKYVYLRPYVREVKFLFVLSDYARRTRRTSSGYKVPQNIWVNSLAKLPNITSYTFCHIPFFSFPQSQNRFLPIPHEQIELTVAALANCSLLDELNLLYRATPSDISRLNHLKNVRSIRLGLPSREVLVAVRPWIEQCDSFSVRDAYALDSLATIRPHVSNLSMLHIGPHHALSNRDLLQLLHCTSKLQELDLFYDNFLNVQLLNKDDRSSLGLKNLHKLVVRHQGVSNKSQFMELFTWLEAVISASPLTSISILSDDSRECNFAMPLINLLAKKPQLEFLNIPQVVLRQPSLRTLFGRLNNLRVLSIMLVDVNVLSFHTSASPGELNFNLSALYLRSSKTTCPYSLVTPQLRQTISSLRGNPGYLRRLCQEKQTWKALWTSALQTERGGIDPLKDEYGLYSNATEEDGW
ncbi:hypothetical protein F5879DRAFT_978668 [Lentinula edodes]|uniref:uncharacterized protein n=1 Tax=Lentinula edodes TaxID=5353 RepID=UPI001E8E1765|nr:uncharacterized protein C8R40DRAFT_1166293 [Lentinula edodes]KAH7880094.1 hypothetical protein C8R40DRAFT_1166293 [Lentinula edodes]KAJ3898936.1 hypothetical protein F5879DRAFT_978668 [Lentinula edodes]